MSEAAKQTRSLVKKLAEVKGAVDRIAKNGHNDHFNYDFATESDIAAAVRKEMSARSLMMFPNVTKTEWEKVPRKNGETKLCTLTVEFTIEDGDSGETRSFTIMGQGEDSMDKATYKAMTGAEKYALLKLFMIPTGDDPEKDTETRHVPVRAAPVAPTAPARSGATHPGSSMPIKFGEGKGKTIAELEDKELEWQIIAADNAVKANDPKWHAANLKKQAALRAEQQLRITHATGKISAPATTSPRQAVTPGPGVPRFNDPELQRAANAAEPVLRAYGERQAEKHKAQVDAAVQKFRDEGKLPAEDEGEEILTASQRFFQLARESGLSGAQLTARAKGVLNGKTSNFTHEDIDTIKASLLAVPA